MTKEELQKIRAAVEAPAGRDYDARCENGSCHKAARVAEHTEELLEEAERALAREVFCRAHAVSLMYFHDRYMVAAAPVDADFKLTGRDNASTHGVMVTVGETSDVVVMYLKEGRGQIVSLDDIRSSRYLHAVMVAANAFMKSVGLE